MAHAAHLQTWLDYMEDGQHDHAALADMLADDVTFWSPIVHTPQRGKAITLAYLGAAGNVLGGDSFKYVRIFGQDLNALLEFECEIDGLYVNGVDIIRWNEAGRIVDFKVMVRPLKAVNLVHANMKAMLERMQADA
ncbi:MAG: nuclear transport factor 2 family protein [Pseudomonadota bacterium]